MGATRIPEMQQALADNLAKLDSPGMTLRKAFSDAGYSQGVADSGWAGVPNKVIKLLAKRGLRYKELGRIDVETQELITRGRLVHNVLAGKDKAVNSAKLLGSDRRVNMFTPDTQVGIVVLSQPNQETVSGLPVAHP